MRGSGWRGDDSGAVWATAGRKVQETERKSTTAGAKRGRGETKGFTNLMGSDASMEVVLIRSGSSAANLSIFLRTSRDLIDVGLSSCYCKKVPRVSVRLSVLGADVAIEPQRSAVSLEI